MSTMTLQTQIDASPLDVFEVVADFPKAAERISGIKQIEMLTDGPVAVGTRFKETRVMFGKEATEEFEVTELVPGERLVLVAESCGCRYVCTHRLTSEGGGTRMELEMDAQPISFFAKLMSPLSFFMAGVMKKAIQKDLDELKAAVEGESRVE
jgi:carbon monoxide dehydrogenase subunit G